MPDRGQLEERVAEALWRANIENAALRGFPYDRLIEPTKDDLRRLARAALAALSGPEEQQLTSEEARAIVINPPPTERAREARKRGIDKLSRLASGEGAPDA